MVEEVENELVRVFLVAQTMDREERYMTDIGQQVFTEFTEAWESLLVPAWGERAIYQRLVDRRLVRPSPAVYKRGPEMLHLIDRTIGWRLVVEDDLSSLSMEQAMQGEMFVPRSIGDMSTWFYRMASTLAKIRLSKPVIDKKHDDSLAFIFEILPARLLGDLRLYLKKLEDDKEFLEGRCVGLERKNEKLDDEVKRLRKELSDYKIDQLRGTANPVRHPPSGSTLKQYMEEKFQEQQRRKNGG